MERKIKEFIEKHSIQIGSRAFGLHTKDSDSDYVMTKNNASEFVKLLEDKRFNLKVVDDYDFKGQIVLPMENLAVVKFEMEDSKYEILVYEYKEFVYFNQINKMMRTLLTNPVYFNRMKKKKKRVLVYNNLMKIIFDLNK